MACSLFIQPTICLLISGLFGKASGITDPAIPAGLFYPFGEDVGDSVLPVGRFNYSEVGLDLAVAFNNEYFGKVNVETNGVLALGHRFEGDVPSNFPLIGDDRILAPYWAGADTSLNNGRVYYRLIDDSTLLDRARDDFQQDLGDTDQLYDFVPQRLLIATWHNITFNRLGTTSTPVNKFQAILAWNRKQTAVSYRYGKLTWTTGGYSGGSGLGLDGSPAVMGYNSGKSDFYYTHEWSNTANILYLVNTSNVFSSLGRFSYRIDRLTNVTDCYDTQDSLDDLCPLPYEEYNSDEGRCEGFAPQFDCPVLTGPTELNSDVRNQKKFEFYCAIVNASNDPQAVYDVTFTFNGQEDCSITGACQNNVSITAGAKMSSDYLRGKNKMGKWIGCKVRSYYRYSENPKSGYFISNVYYMGLEFSTKVIEVTEDETLPKTLVVKSTVPITCSASNTKLCTLNLRYSVINEDDGRSNVAFRQRHSSVNKINLPGRGCQYTIEQGDWKPDEQRAYNSGTPLELLARFDPYTTGPRTARVTFRFDTTNDSVWYGFESPLVQIYHYDVPQPLFRCSINADPHLTTYDGLHYSTHCHGKFYYARNSPGGVGLEVLARHCPCDGKGGAISCVCGVAIREDSSLFIADTCNQERALDFRSIEDYIGTNGCATDGGCGMFTKNSAFKLMTPSGNRIKGTVYGSYPATYINAEVWITARFRNVSGLCGSPDGDKLDDWTFADTGEIRAIPPGFDPNPPKNLVDSWGFGPQNGSLFEFKSNPILPDLAYSDVRNLINYCQCTRTGLVDNKPRCGGSAIADPVWPGEPEDNISIGNDSKGEFCNTYLPSSLCSGAALLRSVPQPSMTDMTDEEINTTCWDRIINEQNLGPTCLAIMLNNTEAAQGLVNQCVLDVQMTGDLSWADDKIRDAQNFCYLDVITRNNSEVNDTSAAIEEIQAILQDVTAFMCTPVNCNGHGDCVNGTCNCTEDYIGSDCGVLKSAVPTIRGLLSPDVIDLRLDSSTGTSVVTADVADTPQTTCKFDTQLLNGFSKSYSTRGVVTSPITVVCLLPREPLSYNGMFLDFTSLHDPGFNFSCLTPGSPVINYQLSVSNDGQNFSNSVKLTLYDSLCMHCTNETCDRLPGTCYINGYCFSDDEQNPYMTPCEVCNTSLSETSWTSAMSNESCIPSLACQDDEICIPDLNFNFTCRNKTEDHRETTTHSNENQLTSKSGTEQKPTDHSTTDSSQQTPDNSTSHSPQQTPDNSTSDHLPPNPPSTSPPSVMNCHSYIGQQLMLALIIAIYSRL